MSSGLTSRPSLSVVREDGKSDGKAVSSGLTSRPSLSDGARGRRTVPGPGVVGLTSRPSLSVVQRPLDGAAELVSSGLSSRPSLSGSRPRVTGRGADLCRRVKLPTFVERVPASRWSCCLGLVSSGQSPDLRSMSPASVPVPLPEASFGLAKTEPAASLEASAPKYRSHAASNSDVPRSGEFW